MERESITSARLPRGITPSQEVRAGLPPPSRLNVEHQRISILQRFLVLGVGFAVGAVFAMWVAGTKMPPRMGLGERVRVWALVMGGPIFGTVENWHDPGIRLSWLSLLCIAAHPLRPNFVTAGMAVLGFLAWFFAGSISAIACVWGA